eukprot:NODE_25798_length_575_cov_1.790179.p1 GENE.NODE_25798_length_575_cov_1.790179~~NODE_25798_length_575_cov_1.790179.p1  ORF type:complete len:129 (-),score=35.11 NODE_25798_length_575_cov_1.790179:83-469(-)
MINEAEFRNIMAKKFLGEDDDSSFVHAAEMLDSNKDGFIPAVEFRQILMKEGQLPLSEQEVDELMMFADLDGDGLIDYRSFLRWLWQAPNYSEGESVLSPGMTTASLGGGAAASALTLGGAGGKSGYS